MKPFERVLIANRGEIARRIAVTLQELGITPVLPVLEKEMEQVIPLFSGCTLVPSGDGIYLDADRLVALAKETGCQAVHPGYGFLAENAGFAAAVEAHDLTFIGPSPAAIEQMGDKERAREAARAAGVSPVPGFSVDNLDEDSICEQAAEIGFPVLVKAAMGGGGKGLRKVDDMTQLADALRVSREEAGAYFGDARVFIEKYIENPRHVEIQVFAFAGGPVVHLGERECTVQRRHQKIIEESPSVVVDDQLRSAMGAAAVRIAQSVGYRGAGTVEFILAPDRSYYFLEMNTRIQVEHPVTEEVYGVDLVSWQVNDAMGNPVPELDTTGTPRGWSLECRIYAEDPARDFMPSPGKILLYREPEGPGVRVESAVRSGSVIFPDFDPMIAKLVVRAETRAAAIDRAVRCLNEFVILGVVTNREYLVRVLLHEQFQEGRFDTGFAVTYRDDLLVAQPEPGPELLALAAWYRKSHGPCNDGETTDAGQPVFPPVDGFFP